MYSEDQLVMISAIQHLAFCTRQCALIHIEQQWADNRATVLGEQLHSKVHSEGIESRRNVRTARSLRLVSYKYGLVGQADVVEFHRVKKNGLGIKIKDWPGFWAPFPVEYKKGKPKRDNIDAVQLCAQALCLEEQFDIRIPDGSLFYGTTRRRTDVSFSLKLRKETETYIQQLRTLLESRKTPVANYTSKCKNCSLIELCNPKWSSLPTERGYQRMLLAKDHDS